MKNANYHSKIKVPVSTSKAFDGICRVDAWWAVNFEGSARKLNDAFTVHFGTTFGSFKLIEVIEDKKIVWDTVDCYLPLFKDKTQWRRTQIVWEILPGDEDHTIIEMTHVGLVPGVECFNDCEKGWDFFIKESLFRLLTVGKGLPGRGIMSRISCAGYIYEGTLFSKGETIPDYPDEYIVVDVRESDGEEVTKSYSVEKLDKRTFDSGKIRGDYFMLIEYKPVSGKKDPLIDLARVLMSEV
ncbi:MAG: hypothetical protein ACHQET_09775 [Chitinophagales bacterium]